jgi:pimeloyl-ACP methyl ester carboxylesterase
MTLFCATRLSAAPDDAPELSDCRLYASEGAYGIKARCGVFERLLDPTDPNSTVLQLNVAVVPALTLEPEPDPFMPIAGGPGGASTNFYAGWSHAFERVRRDRDILLMDQRGTGKSELMACDFGDEVIEGQLSTEETIAYTKQCLDQLPHDPRFFTTSIAVQDMEALRVALGYPSLNLYGSSYGTRVAQHYARRYPESTRSVVIDGVAPPQIALGPDIAIEAQKALESIFARCSEEIACNEAFPDIVQRFDNLRADLARTPASVELAHPVSGKITTVTFSHLELAGALRMMSYRPNTVALIPLLINEAADANFIPLASTFLAVTESMGDQLAIGMHNSVICTEDTPFVDDVDYSSLESTYMGPLMMEALVTICSVWPAGVIDDDLRLPLTTSSPVLLLSGSADPVTPPYFADLAAVDMENARHLTGINQGHGLATQGCMPRILGQFVKTASVDDLDTDCLERLFAMPFFTSFSGPAP